MHWPVVLMYPQSMSSDVIEDVHEDDVVAEHLDVVRGRGLGNLRS